MGFFDFFKKKQPKTVVEGLNLEQLEKKLVKKKEEQTTYLQTTLEQLQEQLEEEKKELVKHTDILLQAQLQNKNYPERAIQIMEGNRKTYVQKAQKFNEKINLPKEPEAIQAYYKKFNEQLNTFGEGTIKNYKVLQQFFSHETTAILTTLKKIEDYMKKAEEATTKAQITTLEDIKKQIQKAQEQKKEKEELKNIITEKKKELQQQASKVQEEEEKLKKLQTGEAYKTYEQLQTKEKQRKEELEEQTTQFTRNIGSINTALKKYERLIEEKTTIQNYLTNPEEALQKDKELSIVRLLKSLRETIIKGDLELKQGKKEKIIKELDTFTHSYFTNYQQQKQTLQEQITKLQKEQKEMSIIISLQKQEQQIQEEKEKEEKEVELLREQMEKYEQIQLPTLKKELEEQIKEHLQEEITLTI
jgi:hypothetical protein|tara:strand:- start:23553 stop:24803 length:1251 start_codon:yes stop_codon:yes gene_type:complete